MKSFDSTEESWKKVAQDHIQCYVTARKNLYDT